MVEAFDAYHTWLGIPPEEQPPHHYRLLGIKPFEDKPDVIEHAADRQMAHLRTFQAGKHSALSQKLLNEVAAAKICLLRPDKKAAYDAQLGDLLGRQSAGDDTSPQNQSLRALGQLLGEELARPVSQRKKSSSASPPWLAMGIGGAVLLVGIVAWSLMGRGKVEVAQKAEEPPPVAPPLPAVEQADTQSVPGVFPRPPIRSPQTPVTMEPAKPKAEATPPPVATAGAPRSSAAPAHSSAAAESGKPKAERAQALPVAPRAANAGSPSSAASSPLPAIPNPQSLVAKRPLPPPADQERSKQAAQDLFRDDYTKAKKPSERADLARRILQKGLAAREPAADQYALLCLARDVALSADDDRLACASIDEIAKSFEADALAMQADALATMSKSTRSTAALHKAICERALAFGQEAVDQDKHDLADTLAKLASSEAGKVRDKELVQRARSFAKDQHEAAKAFSTVQDALTALKKEPADPAANLAVGKYLCFTKGDWTRGLPHLAKSDDAKLKALAAEDLKNTPAEWNAASVSPPEPVVASIALGLADGWWDAGQKAIGKEHEAMLLRAGYWYKQAASEAGTELIQAKIEKRLEAIAKLGRPIPEPAMLTNSIGMRLVLIPAGEFFMGSTPEEIAPAIEEAKKKNDTAGLERLLSETPKHRVRITKPFYMGMYAVTQGEYQRVVGTNPSSFSASGRYSAGVAGQDSSRHPVDSIHWGNAVEFCQRLSALPKERAAKRAYRLPTEAEWEYACRAGTTTPWSFGDEKTSRCSDYAWIGIISKGRTHPVGQKKPNAWGLYDMHGNVWQWCLDWYSPDFYRQSPLADPLGPPTGDKRVLRGGHWWAAASTTRSAHRSCSPSGYRDAVNGLRVVVGR